MEGIVYGTDYTSPTPSKLTTTISDMEMAFADAAGRSILDHVELYTGDLTAVSPFFALQHM